ncbi:hypothetical protein [Streptomyces sp. URMC 125]|uniref:hypothetical protein n=1 Tax=Streptomyces sp. URMC 125 TaxID=3423419 RepID=UPI003F1DE956
MTMQEFPEDPLPGQSALNNQGVVVQVGRSNSAPITILRRPTLPTFPVPDQDRTAASDPLWAHTPTPQRAAELLADCGLAVIVGEHGTGRRISAVRAAQTYLAARHGNPRPELFDVTPDWSDEDDDRALHAEMLPATVPGYGYLLDVTPRPLSAAVTLKLVSWADSLHAQGACLVITANPRGWQGDRRFEVPARPPHAVQVARNHLTERLKSPVQAQWLQPKPQQTAPRHILRGSASHDATVGVFSDLITPRVSPADAVAIAERLHRIRPERVAAAVERCQDKQPEVWAQGDTELKAIREEALLWEDFLEEKLVAPGTRGQDRLMLLSAAYLEGAPLESCIKAAIEFGPRDEAAARRYREGRSPRRRMLDVGVDISPQDTAAFIKRPGLPLAAIRMDWHHWTTERKDTEKWIKHITAPGGVAEAWVPQIGERLLELSLTAVDPPLFSILDEWTDAAAPGTERLQLVARLLTKASEKGELAQRTHSKLLDWAKVQKASQREVVARTCGGDYGRRWPHRALVRLRHILAQDDEATQIASNALVEYAARAGTGLTLVIDTIETWLEKYPTHPAGPRAFLALTNPAHPVSALDKLIPLAQTSPRVRDFLITGWQKTLGQPEVRDQAYQVLLAWAQAVHDEQLDMDFTFGVLTDVRNAHTPVDALSRFLYGSPDHEDQALINARRALANLRTCLHTQCARPDCPLGQPESTTDGSPTAGADDLEE